MSELNSLLNIPTSIELKLKNGIKTLEVRELTVLEKEKIQNDTLKQAKQDWLGSIKEIANIVDDQKERRLYLAQMTSSSPDLTDRINNILMNTNTWFLLINQVSPIKLTKEEWLEVIGDMEKTSESLFEAIRIIWGIKNKEVVEIEKSEKSETGESKTEASPLSVQSEVKQ